MSLVRSEVKSGRRSRPQQLKLPELEPIGRLQTEPRSRRPGKPPTRGAVALSVQPQLPGLEPDPRPPSELHETIVVE